MQGSASGPFPFESTSCNFAGIVTTGSNRPAAAFENKLPVWRRSDSNSGRNPCTHGSGVISTRSFARSGSVPPVLKSFPKPENPELRNGNSFQIPLTHLDRQHAVLRLGGELFECSDLPAPKRSGSTFGYRSARSKRLWSPSTNRNSMSDACAAGMQPHAYRRKCGIRTGRTVPRIWREGTFPFPARYPLLKR